MAFPQKKPGVSVSILGIGGRKPPREEPPPPYSGAQKPAVAPMADAPTEEMGENIITCPGCGERYMLTPVESEEPAPAEDAEYGSESAA